MAPRCAPHDSESTSWVGVLQLYGGNSYGPKSSPYPVSRALPGDAGRKSMALLGDTACTSLGLGRGGSYGPTTHASSLRRRLFPRWIAHPHAECEGPGTKTGEGGGKTVGT